MPAAPDLLPSSLVRFAPDFLARVGRLVARLSAARERREGPGRASFLGSGIEFVGFRPYRPGEDVRALDWQLLARLSRPFVRVAKKEASERFAVLCDTSASMGVGFHGKLQRAAEAAAALGAVALRARAEVEIIASGVPDSFRARRREDVRRLLAFLEGCRAEGRSGLGSLLAEPARFKGAGALFLIGDCLDFEPSLVSRALRRGRSLFCLQILADEELLPPRGAVRWVDAETLEKHAIEVDRATQQAYEETLERRIEALSAWAARHRAFHGCWTAATPFERIVEAVFED